MNATFARANIIIWIAYGCIAMHASDLAELEEMPSPPLPSPSQQRMREILIIITSESAHWPLSKNYLSCVCACTHAVRRVRTHVQ